MAASASGPSEASTTTARLTTAEVCAHATRAAASARRADGRRDTRHVVRTVAGANHGLHASGLSPRSCRALRAILAQTHEHTTLEGERRAHEHQRRPPNRALTRHGQRRPLRRADGRRDTRLDRCCVTDANHGLRATGLSPRSCRTLRAILAQTQEHTTLEGEHTTPGATYAAGDEHVAFVRHEHTALAAMHAVLRAVWRSRNARPQKARSRDARCTARSERHGARAQSPSTASP
jgi:hypothetical protein